jgi:hypothetical protein
MHTSAQACSLSQMTPPPTHTHTHAHKHTRALPALPSLQPLGTGQMLKSLREGDVDVIVALTEGLVLDMAKASVTVPAPVPTVVLMGTYVQSPLTWAVSTGATSPYHTIESLRVGHCPLALATAIEPRHLLASVRQCPPLLYSLAHSALRAGWAWSHACGQPFQSRVAIVPPHSCACPPLCRAPPLACPA